MSSSHSAAGAIRWPRWTLAAIVWWQRRRIGRGPVAAIAMFLCGLFPALGFFDVYPFKFSFVADHFAYHALPVAAAAVAAGLAATAAWLRVPLAPAAEATACADVVEPRRKFIEEFGKEVKNLDI